MAITLQDVAQGSGVLNSGSGSNVTEIYGPPDTTEDDTFFSFTHRGGGNTASASSIRGIQTGDDRIEIAVSNIASNTIDFEYEMFEFDSAWLVQEVEDSVVSDGDTNTLSPAVDESESFISYQMAERGGGTWGADDFQRCTITSTTEVTWNTNGSPSGETVVFRVCEHPDLSVQEVVHTLTNFEDASDTVPITDLAGATAFIMCTGQQNLGGPAFDDQMFRFTLTNDTTITIERTGTASITAVFTFYIITVPSSVNVQEAEIAMSASENSNTANITAVGSVAETMSFAQGVYTTAHGQTGETDDDSTSTMVTVTLTDTTTIKAERSAHGGFAASFYVVAIDWNFSAAAGADIAPLVAARRRAHPLNQKVRM